MSSRYGQGRQENQSRSVNYDRLAVEEALENIKRRERLAQYSTDKEQNEQQLRDAEEKLPGAKQRLDEAESKMKAEGIPIDTEAWNKLVADKKEHFDKKRSNVSCAGLICAIVLSFSSCGYLGRHMDYIDKHYGYEAAGYLMLVFGIVIPIIVAIFFFKISNQDKKMSAFEKAHKTEYKYYDAEQEYEALVSTKQRCEEFLSQPAPPDCTYEYVGCLTDAQQDDQDLLEAILRYFDQGRATNARDATNLYYEELDRKQQVEYTRQAAQNTREAANYAAATYSRMSDIAEKQADANRDMNRQIGDLAQHVHDTNRRIDDMQS